MTFLFSQLRGLFTGVLMTVANHAFSQLDAENASFLEQKTAMNRYRPQKTAMDYHEPLWTAINRHGPP